MRETPSIIDEIFAAKEEAIKKLFPEVWTHISNIDMLPIRWQLKLMGFDYRSEQQFADLMASLEEKRLILREGHTIKRNPQQVYKTA